MHALSRNMATFSFLPFFMISMLLMAICIAVFQAYYYDEIIYSRYLKMTWRLAFLTIVFYAIDRFKYPYVSMMKNGFEL